MNPDIIPVLIVFGAGAALGAAGTWLAGFARRVRRWRTLCQPPPVPVRRVPLWADGRETGSLSLGCEQ